MTDKPEAGAPTPEAGPPSSDASAADGPPPGPPAPGSGNYGDLLHLQDAVRLIEEKRQVGFTADDVERQKFLKHLKRGEFPPPSKPTPKLPRIDGGEVDWAECWWAKEDIELWLEGSTSAEKWEQRWNSFTGVKTWRDLPSLASYAARRVVKGEGEWEHWADRYRPRSFSGQFLRFLAWAGAIGALAFFVLPPLNDQLIEKDDKGNNRTYALLFESDDKPSRVIKQNTNVIDKDVYFYFDVESSERQAANALQEDGRAVHAQIKQWRTKKSKDTNEPFYVDSAGEFLLDPADKQPIPKGRYHYLLKEKGVPVTSFLAFLAAPLDSILPSLTVPLAIFIVLVGVPALIVLYKFCYGWLSLSYVLTDSRLIVREGLLARHEHQVRVIQIHDLSVHQGLLQVMLGVGDIVVHSDDVDTPELIIQGIRDPRAVKDRLFAVSEAGKQEKRYFIESSSKGANNPKPAR